MLGFPTFLGGQYLRFRAVSTRNPSSNYHFFHGLVTVDKHDRQARRILLSHLMGMGNANQPTAEDAAAPRNSALRPSIRRCIGRVCEGSLSRHSFILPSNDHNYVYI